MAASSVPSSPRSLQPPVCSPLQTLDELLDWQPYSNANDTYARCTVPLRDKDKGDYSSSECRKGKPIKSVEEGGRGILLVCHDMKGGYCEDKWVQGCVGRQAKVGATDVSESEEDDGDLALVSACVSEGEAEERRMQQQQEQDEEEEEAHYRIWEWDCVDIFVYFSHHLVTVPPCTWSNACHANGTMVLGTFITEWEAGATLCSRMLASDDVAQQVAWHLSRVAAFYGFDGWLINIENAIRKDHIPRLLFFLRSLCSQIRAIIPHALVLWYDSVTDAGHLAWQDALTLNNKLFFDACHGIFTNYSWKGSRPVHSSVSLARSRSRQVLMGVDVFEAPGRAGRGFSSGAAVHVAVSGGASAAVFAPGWVFETKQPPDFETAQSRLWNGIRAGLCTCQPALCVCEVEGNGRGEQAGRGEGMRLAEDQQQGQRSGRGDGGGKEKQEQELEQPEEEDEDEGRIQDQQRMRCTCCCSCSCASQPFPLSLPLYSCFDEGVGSHLSISGRLAAKAAWFNLSCQTQPPICLHRSFPVCCFQPQLSSSSPHQHTATLNAATHSVSVSLSKQLSFEGGSSLAFHLNPSPPSLSHPHSLPTPLHPSAHPSHPVAAALVPLFNPAIPLHHSTPLSVSFSVMSFSRAPKVVLLLQLQPPLSSSSSPHPPAAYSPHPPVSPPSPHALSLDDPKQRPIVLILPSLPPPSPPDLTSLPSSHSHGSSPNLPPHPLPHPPSPSSSSSPHSPDTTAARASHPSPSPASPACPALLSAVASAAFPGAHVSVVPASSTRSVVVTQRLGQQQKQRQQRQHEPQVQGQRGGQGPPGEVSRQPAESVWAEHSFVVSVADGEHVLTAVQALLLWEGEGQGQGQGQRQAGSETGDGDLKGSTCVGRSGECWGEDGEEVNDGKQQQQQQEQVQEQEEEDHVTKSKAWSQCCCCGGGGFGCTWPPGWQQAAAMRPQADRHSAREEAAGGGRSEPEGVQADEDRAGAEEGRGNERAWSEERRDVSTDRGECVALLGHVRVAGASEEQCMKSWGQWSNMTAEEVLWEEEGKQESIRGQGASRTTVVAADAEISECTASKYILSTKLVWGGCETIAPIHKHSHGGKQGGTEWDFSAPSQPGRDSLAGPHPCGPECAVQRFDLMVAFSLPTHQATASEEQCAAVAGGCEGGGRGEEVEGRKEQEWTAQDPSGSGSEHGGETGVAGEAKGQWVWLGASHVPAFVVSQLPVPLGCVSVHFQVVPKAVCGARPTELNDCPSCSIECPRGAGP